MHTMHFLPLASPESGDVVEYRKPCPAPRMREGSMSPCGESACHDSEGPYILPLGMLCGKAGEENEQWPGKSSNLTRLRYAQRVELTAEPPGGPARPVATITWRRVGHKSLDADIPYGG
jgi:hypothetical protein